MLANIPRGAHGIVPLGEKRRVWESRCGGYVIWWEIEFVGIRGWINARYVEACIQADDGVTLSCRPTITASRDPCADTELRSPFPF